MQRRFNFAVNRLDAKRMLMLLELQLRSEDHPADQDYINFVSNEEIVKQMITKEGVNYKKLIDTIPSTPIPNYMFKNL